MNAAVTTSTSASDEGPAGRPVAEEAFDRLIEPFRRQLHAHCYRMLGSMHDADDALQDALLRAWRGLSGFDRRRPLRPWLYKITTNTCLDLIQRRSRRMLPTDRGVPAGPDEEPGDPLFDWSWLEPYADEELGRSEIDTSPSARYEQSEAVELAFVAALQHLSARQRAVLILRDVLDFSASEVATALDATTASVNSALQRARRTINERAPSRSQQANIRSLGDERARWLLQAYIDAWERRDVDAIVTLLADDATFAMPPYERWWRGRRDIGAYLQRSLPACPQARSVITHANGQPAVAWYLWDAVHATYAATSIDVPSLRGDLVKDIVTFVNPDLFPHFGLPSELST